MADQRFPVEADNTSPSPPAAAMIDDGAPPVKRDAAYWKARRESQLKAPEHPCAALANRSTSCVAAMGDAAGSVCSQAFRDYKQCLADVKNAKAKGQQ